MRTFASRWLIDLHIGWGCMVSRRVSGSYATALLATLLVPALAGAQTAPPAASPAAVPVEATPPADPAVAPLPSVVSPDYIIGPGDSLQIFVWRNPDLTTSVPVRPDGKISTPLVEDMVVVGKTPSQLARDIEKVLATYVRTPQVNVIVTQAASLQSRISVVGQVAQPQSVPYREGMRVLDVILQVGGLGPFAAGNRARIVRVENGREVEIRVKLENLVNDGDMRQNVPVKPNDVLIVPQSFF